ncbi:hypothetical protein L4D76_10250 [Photobacterium sagamiensis]|uniref:hypothetical protein n=1 Tax=Photobacterium sagamiensis TaxID=2910241 RepID=UPI003D0995AD
MKKNILEVNNILTSLKQIAPTREREYIRLIWSITNHIAIHSANGKEQEIEVMTDLRQFIELLNEKYPIGSDENIGYDSYLIPERR